MKFGSLVTSLTTVGFIAVSFSQVSHATDRDSNIHYSSSELRKLTQEANTPEQYAVLAAYHSQKEVFYQQQASEEKLEWERRSLNVTGPAAKYPRPVDSAHSLYDYYTSKAASEGSLANYYQKLGESAKPIANK